MGPRKRSKPNPQAEAVAESESLAVHDTAKSEVETQKQLAPSTSESPPTLKPDPSDKAVTADNVTVTLVKRYYGSMLILFSNHRTALGMVELGHGNQPLLLK